MWRRTVNWSLWLAVVAARELCPRLSGTCRVNAAHCAERAPSPGAGRLAGSSPETFVSIQATPFDSAPCTAAFLVRPSRRPPLPITWRSNIGACELSRKNETNGSETCSCMQSSATICNRAHPAAQFESFSSLSPQGARVWWITPSLGLSGRS